MARRDAARELDEIDRIFGGLAHASRRQILLVLLYHGGSMSAGEIANRFECSWPTTTRHLRVLESADLVRVEKRGRERVYHLNTALLDSVVGGWLSRFAP